MGPGEGCEWRGVAASRPLSAIGGAIAAEKMLPAWGRARRGKGRSAKAMLAYGEIWGDMGRYGEMAHLCLGEEVIGNGRGVCALDTRGRGREELRGASWRGRRHRWRRCV